MEKIHTGKVQEIAEVLRALFLLKHDKELSFGERKLLDQAKTLLVKELSLAQNILEADVERELEAIFGT
jgi:CarD family transcriptional regulator